MGKRIISASQISDFTTCPRKWWFKRIPRLPEPPKSYFTFGTVLHECAERFLRATENGRVPMPGGLEHGEHEDVWDLGPFKGQRGGEPVDLYPKGWETITERNGTQATLTPNEAKQVQKVVDEAIKNGTLVRDERLQIEREINIDVIPGVSLTGFIDIYKPAEHSDDCAAGLGHDCDCGAIAEIHDHKSFSKSGARYLKQAKTDSPNYVGDDQQLRTYAAVTSLIDGHAVPVIVRHNQYPKFPGRKVRSMSSEPIYHSELMEHWEWIKREAAEMLKVAKIERWEDSPGPREDDACQKYGGCPFAGICTRQESIDVYKQRVERESSAADGQQRINIRLEAPRKRRTTGGTDMPKDIFAGARAKRGAKAEAQAKATQPDTNPVTGAAKPSAKPAPKPAAAKPAAKLAAPAPKASVPAGHGAPWASATCKACKGSGFNSAGNACPICAATAKQRGVPSPTDYVIQTEGTGFVAVAKESAIEKLEGLGAPLQWSSADGTTNAVSPSAAAQEPAEEPTVAEESEPEPAEGEAEESEPEPAEQSAEESVEGEAEQSTKEPAKGRGRPRVGMSLFIGCTQIRGTRRDTITSSEVLERFGAALASAMGAESYWALDTWKRRERLAQKAEYIVGELAKMQVIHPGELGNDDVGSLVRALMSVQEGVDQVVIA